MTTTNTTKETLSEMIDTIRDEIETVAKADWTDDERRDRAEAGLPLYLDEWLDESVLEVLYIVGSDGSYRGAELLLVCGGPTITLATRYGRVDGHWSTKEDWALVEPGVCAAIDDILREAYETVR